MKRSVLKFKIDENLPVEIKKLLEAHGHDAITVIEQGLGGAADIDVARVCRIEQRALLTLDLHFSNIRMYPPSEYAGIVVLRLARQDKGNVCAALERVVSLFEAGHLHGSILIVDERTIRVRRART